MDPELLADDADEIIVIGTSKRILLVHSGDAFEKPSVGDVGQADAGFEYQGRSWSILFTVAQDDWLRQVHYL